MVNQNSLYQIVAERVHNLLFSALFNSLIAIQNAVQQTLTEHGLSARVHLGCQYFSRFGPHLEFCESLSSLPGEPVRVYAHADNQLMLPPRQGIKYIAFDEVYPLRDEWFILVSGPDFWTALIARQINPDVTDPEQRRYQSHWSFDAQTVDQLERQLMAIFGRDAQYQAVAHNLSQQAYFTTYATNLAIQGFAQVQNRLQAKFEEHIRIDNLLHHYLDKEIRADIERVAAEGGTGLENRTQIASIVWVDMVGFTGLAETLPPEQVVRLLNTYYSLLGPTVYDHHGWVAQYQGDGMIAVFPDPLSAMRAAVTMRAQVGGVQIEGQAVEVRIGVNTGEVIVATLGAPGRFERTVIGDTVNVACRLPAMAQPGEILVSEKTLDQLGREVEWPLEIMPLVGLKGKGQLVTFYRLTG